MSATAVGANYLNGMGDAVRECICGEKERSHAHTHMRDLTHGTRLVCNR